MYWIPRCIYFWIYSIGRCTVSPDLLNLLLYWSPGILNTHPQMHWIIRCFDPYRCSEPDISILQIFYSQLYWIPRSIDPLIYWIPIPRCTESSDVLIPQTYCITRCTESRDVLVPRRIEISFSNAKINPCDLQLKIIENNWTVNDSKLDN